MTKLSKLPRRGRRASSLGTLGVELEDGLKGFLISSLSADLPDGPGPAPLDPAAGSLDPTLGASEEDKEAFLFWAEILGRYRRRGGRSREEFCAAERHVFPGEGRERALTVDELKRLQSKEKNRRGERLYLCDQRRYRSGRRLKVQDGPLIYCLFMASQNPGWSPKDLRISLRRFLDDADCPYQWQLPSSGQLRRALARVPAAAQDYLLRGHKGWWSGYALMPFSPALRANDVWVCDIFQLTRLRFRVRHAAGQTFSPYAIFVMDAASRALHALLLFEGRATAETALGVLRAAMFPKGRHQEFYPDPAQPKVFLTDRESIFRTAAVRLACRQMGYDKEFSLPGQPSSNAFAERFVSTFKKKYLPLLEDAIIEHFGLRPDVTSELWEVVREKVQEAVRDYHFAPHRGHEGSVSPLRWHRLHGQAAVGAPPLSRQEIVAATMLEVPGVPVTPEGVTYRGRQYRDACLQAVVGQEVTLRVHPLQDNEAVEVWQEGRPVGRAAWADPGCSHQAANALIKSNRAEHAENLGKFKFAVDAVGRALVKHVAGASRSRRRKTAAARSSHGPGGGAVAGKAAPALPLPPAAPPPPSLDQPLGPVLDLRRQADPDEE